jgi:hemerythrin-like domain-containing protein
MQDASPGAAANRPDTHARGKGLFQALDQAHQAVNAMLVQLGTLMARLEDHGVDPEARRLAKEALEFFNEFAQQHHAHEEQAVFPALLASSDVELVQHVRRLQQDHGWLEEDWIELQPQLAAVADGYSWYNLDELRHGVEVYTELYQEHIELEESLVFPAAKRQFADDSASARSRRAARAKADAQGG